MENDLLKYPFWNCFYSKNAINLNIYSYCERFDTQLVWVFWTYIDTHEPLWTPLDSHWDLLEHMWTPADSWGLLLTPVDCAYIVIRVKDSYKYGWRLQSGSARVNTLRLSDKTDTEDIWASGKVTVSLDEWVTGWITHMMAESHDEWVTWWLVSWSLGGQKESCLVYWWSQKNLSLWESLYILLL